MSRMARSSGLKKPPACRGTSSKLRAMRLSAGGGGGEQSRDAEHYGALREVRGKSHAAESIQT